MKRLDRYTMPAIVLHWLIAAMVFAQFTLGWWMQEIAKQPPGPRASAFNFHKSIGIAILALMVTRVAWRATHPPPALPAMPRWQAALARANHAILYAALILLPVTGYLGSEFSGYPVRLFGVTLPSWAGKQPQLKELMTSLHYWTTWVLAAAFLAHLGGVIKHTWIDRDGLLGRMGWSRAGLDASLTSGRREG